MKRQVEKQKTKQVRINQDFHQLLRVEAAENYSTIKSLLEEKAGWTPKNISPTRDDNE